MLNFRILIIACSLLIFPLQILGKQAKNVSAILIDNTGSMRGQFDRVKEISKAASQDLVSNGPLCIFNFEFRRDGTRELGVVNGGSSWITDPKRVAGKIDALGIEPGQTQLFDAMGAIRQVIVSKADADGLSSKYLVIVTDGDERASDSDQKTLIADLKLGGVRVFAIGLVDDLGDKKKKAVKLLRSLAEETGGYAIFPKADDKTSLQAMIADLFANHPTKPSK